MITQAELKGILHYCPETGVFTWLVAQSRNVKPGDVAGSLCKTYGKTYCLMKIQGKRYKAHRLAYLYMSGSFPESQIDHEDGNGANNRWNNIKLATNAQNHKNRRKPSNNTSGYCGVNPTAGKSDKWKSSITVNGKQIHLGYFVNINDAIEARKAAELQYGFHANHGTDRPL